MSACARAQPSNYTVTGTIYLPTSLMKCACLIYSATTCNNNVNGHLSNVGKNRTHKMDIGHNACIEILAWICPSWSYPLPNSQWCYKKSYRRTKLGYNKYFEKPQNLVFNES